jgi:hypothetical protein
MAVTLKNYNHKNPGLQVVQFDTSSVQAMEEVRDWVVAQLPVNSNDPEATQINLRTSMGGALSWTVDNGMNWKMVRPAEFICKDSNGKLFVLSQELLDAFYDEV